MTAIEGGAAGDPMLDIATHALEQAAPWIQLCWSNTIDDPGEDGSTASGAAASMPSTVVHRHDFYEMLWFRRFQGSGVHRVDFVDHRIRPGDLFLLAPEQIHSLGWPASARIDFYILMIRCEHLALLGVVDLVEALFHDPGRPQPLSVTGAAARKLSLLLDELSEELAGRVTAAEQATVALLHLLLVHTLRVARAGAPSAVAASSHATRFVAFRRLLEAHYHEAPTVSDLARRLGLSERQLNRICKEVSGRSTHQLIHDRVGLEARRLLCNSRQSVKEIAFVLGFSDPGYFSRFFRALYACSPAAFRAKMSEKYKPPAVSSMESTPAST